MLQEQNSLFAEIFTHNAKAHLLETTRWTKFLAILAMIFLALFFVAFILMQYYSNAMFTAARGGLTSSLLGVVIFFVLIMLVYIYPIWMLFMFSKFIKNGILNEDMQLIEQGFKCQKNMFKFLGVFTIIVLALYVLIIAITVYTTII